MKNLLHSFSVLAVYCVSCFSSAMPTETSHEDKAQTLFKDYLSAYEQLEIPGLNYAYLDNLKALGTVEDLDRQLSVLNEYKSKLAGVDKARLSLCSRLELSRASSDVELGTQRALLGLQYLKGRVGEPSDKGLYSVYQGRDWYTYFLKAYLGSDISPEELYQFGQKQLAAAIGRYRAVQKEMGFAGDLEGFLKHLSTTPEFASSNHTEILASYKNKQQIVRGNIAKHFYVNEPMPLVAIHKSDKGMAFPAPGWASEEGFFYNVFAEQYDLRQMDWLFLHEATPGHIFQRHIAQRQNHCNSVLSDRSPSAYTEGWAAYVETLGEDLGLYQTPQEKLGGIEWDMIRSARVVLDVAINYYGWSNEKALQYWQENVIGQDAVAMREINRMRNWPAQVITYKYGAATFLRMKQQYLENKSDAGSVRDYHDLAIAYGPMPLSSFEALVNDAKNWK